MKHGSCFFEKQQILLIVRYFFIYYIWEIFKFIMDLENYFKNGKIYIWKETFAMIKAKKPYLNAFANIIDKNEKN